MKINYKGIKVESDAEKVLGNTIENIVEKHMEYNDKNGICEERRKKLEEKRKKREQKIINEINKKDKKTRFQIIQEEKRKNKELEDKQFWKGILLLLLITIVIGTFAIIMSILVF